MTPHLYPPPECRVKWQATLKRLRNKFHTIVIHVPDGIDPQASAKVIRGWGYKVAIEFWADDDACLSVSPQDT